MAKILFLTLVFPPDGVSTASIMGDLATDFHAAGHRVVVLTTTPHYNLPEKQLIHHTWRRLWGGAVWAEECKGIRVFRIAMPKKTSNLMHRVLCWLWFHAVSTGFAIASLARPDVLIAPSPPLSIGLAAYLISKRFHCPFIYNVQELYPDIAHKLHFIKNQYLFWLLLRIEAFIYSNASAVTVITAGMKKRLSEKGVPANKVVEIPNFVDTQQFHPAVGRMAECRILGNVDAKFIVSYAGNIGPAQDLGFLIDAAICLEVEQDIHFVMMGSGIQAEMLKQRARKSDCKNVSFFPYQPAALIPEFYQRSNLSVVALAGPASCDAVPSKVYRIMACGSAVLAITSTESDLADLVGVSQCGIVVTRDRPERLASIIAEAARNASEIREMGKRGADYVMRYHSRHLITSKYCRLCEEVVDRSANTGARGRSSKHISRP